MTHKIRGKFVLCSVVLQLVTAGTQEIDVCSTDLGCKSLGYS